MRSIESRRMTAGAAVVLRDGAARLLSIRVILVMRRRFVSAAFGAETLARDLSAIGVRVNTILPGLIDTPIYGAGEGAEEFKAKLARDVLFPKRLGRGEEFATLCVELLANSYINAESIRLDAGIRMQPK